jgi:hypothetical protein
MRGKSIALGAGFVAVLAVAAFLLVPRQTVQGQEAGAGLAKSLSGANVEIYFKDQEARQTGFECIFSLDATVGSVNETGLFVSSTKKWIRNTYLEDNKLRVEDGVQKDFKFSLFIPWTAVKYVKVVK